MADMEIGISTASYFPRLVTEDAMDALAMAGAKVCEVFFASHCEYDTRFAALVKERADRGGVRVNSVHALTNQFEPELFGRGLRSHADAVETFKKVCDAGKVLGAKYYVFHGATRLKPAVKYVFDFDFLAERVRGLCEIAEERGIELTYENVHWCWFSEPEYFTEIGKRCPDVCATLDVKQAIQSGGDVYSFLAAMRSRLATVHLCDCVGVETALPGRGGFDFAGFIGALKREGVDAPLILEAYSKDYADVKELITAYEYIKGLAE